MAEGHEQAVVEEEKSEIPADVYGQEILPYLPATNLQTLKTVSKDWLQLIDSPYFVRLHHSRAHRSRIRVIVTFSSEIVEYNNYDDQDMKQFPYPPQFSSDNMRQFSALNIETVGSADGLICMFDRKFDKVGGLGVLFNPSTGKCLQLWPQSPEFYRIVCSWFGKSVDGKSVDGEYVLVMGSFSPRGYELGVYKLTSSKLKHIHSIFVDLRFAHAECYFCLDRGTLVHGAVHWPVKRGTNRRSRFTILAYDIYENKHWEMLPPVQCDFRLGVNVDGCLFAIVKNVFGKVFEVWVMRDSTLRSHGSWTKWANIEGFNINSIVLSPLGFFPNGDLILDVDELRLMKYDFNDNEATVLMEYECRRYEAIMCADTLVSPFFSD